MACSNTGLSSVPKDKDIEKLLKEMTLEEKIGQMTLLTSSWDATGPTFKGNYLEDIRNARCGNVFNAHTTDFIRDVQRIAVEETRLGIPILFGYDVIHGHKTIFPIPLAESCSWDIDAIEESARVAAVEAAASGLNWTFAPMCDICVDPRWGRICEGAGEDPYLGYRIAEARVRGFQGDNLADPLTVLACVKHFAAYGGAEAGRDYNTVDMSPRYLSEYYLPPYKAALDAGALSVMTSFNEIDGVPSSGNDWLLNDLLKEEWQFPGLVVTDYTSINEMVNHGIVEDEAEAGVLAANAGVDMDMQGLVYFKYLENAVREGRVSEKTIDDAVRRILYVKKSLGLFEDPYRYCDKAREDSLVYCEEHLEQSKEMAMKSMVLLKNNGALPLVKGEKLAVIGELATSTRDYLGSWKGAGEWKNISAVLDVIREYNGASNVIYAKGCSDSGTDKSGFSAALAAAGKADKVVFVMGEDWNSTGEAASVTSIRVPGVQSELLSALKKTGKPVVVVLMNGRPLDLSRESEDADAILEAWFPGSMTGEAVTDVLFGEYNPSGKLAVTFPRNLGQVPIYHYAKNTGRPVDVPRARDKYKSKYIDCSNTPLYPFGYGLSYTAFEYSDLGISSESFSGNGKVTVSVNVTNIGDRQGEEVVQLYIRDLVGSVTRPVRQLKGFEKIALEPGETKTVSFDIDANLISFYRKDMSFGPEPGRFHAFVGGSSDVADKVEFEYR